MSSIQSIETPQDYVNYTFNLTTRGVTEVTSELTGMSSTVSNLVGLMAFKTSEYLSNTEAMLVGFGYAAAATFTTATQQAIRFEQALADVKAIGGETTDALAIGQAAMKYSNQFGMNVDAMTEGLEALSRAGLTATNVMSGILEEGVKLSKLEGMDLEDSINNLISTTNLLAEGGYDVNSQDYAEMVKAMNQHIVSTSESAPINAQNIIQTLQHVGGYASANKIDQDDLFAVIAQLGSKGTKGEMAGTALRAFIAAGQKDQAQRALKRIGLEPADLWDNTGEAMLPISEMKAILDDALETRGYSQQEKLEFYADFAGYKQANQIMKINVDEVQNYKENISQAWDLGTKLETILGTVHSNIQIISQTVKNFMTRVGNTMLPILNAVLQPIKWVVQLIDAMPFSEQIVGMGLTFLALKGLFVGVNRVVPAIASLYTSFTRQEKQVKSIKGHFKNLLNDAKEFKETIEHIKDPEWNATKRMQNDKSGMGAVEYSRAVAQIMYDSLKGKDITGKAYDELSKYEQNNFIELVASLGQDKELYQSIVSQIDKRSLALRDAIINLQSLPTEEVTIDIPSKSGTSKRDINSKITQQRAGMQEQSNEAKKGNQLNEQNIKVLKDTYKDIQGLKQYIMSHTDTGTNQYDIGRGIMSIAHPFSEILANAFFKRKDTKEFDTKAGSISFDSQIGIQATNELNNIFEDVQNNISNLPDISFYYDNNVDKMKEQAQLLVDDIKNVAEIFSNIDVDDMHWYQGVRALKSVDIQAMGKIGINYSEMMNEAYIREVLNQENFDKNNEFIKNIYDEQVELLAESLNIDISEISNKVDKIEAIYNAFKSKKNTKSINEVVNSSTQWYHDSLDERVRPSENAAKWLNDDAAKYIMDMLNISYDNTKTNMSEQLQNHFINKDITMETRWMVRQLAFALQKSQTSNVYSEPETAELKYMIEHLAALNQSIKKMAVPGLTELAEILYELGPEDFEKYKKDILTGRAFITTPARIRNKTYYDEDELKEAHQKGDITDAEYDTAIRQVYDFNPDDMSILNSLRDSSGYDVMDTNEDNGDPYDENVIIEALQNIKQAIESFNLTPITNILKDIKNSVNKIIKTIQPGTSLLSLNDKKTSFQGIDNQHAEDISAAMNNLADEIKKSREFSEQMWNGPSDTGETSEFTSSSMFPLAPQTIYDDYIDVNATVKDAEEPNLNRIDVVGPTPKKSTVSNENGILDVNFIDDTLRQLPEVALTMVRDFQLIGEAVKYGKDVAAIAYVMFRNLLKSADILKLPSGEGKSFESPFPNWTTDIILNGRPEDGGEYYDPSTSSFKRNIDLLQEMFGGEDSFINLLEEQKFEAAKRKIDKIRQRMYEQPIGPGQDKSDLGIQRQQEAIRKEKKQNEAIAEAELQKREAERVVGITERMKAKSNKERLDKEAAEEAQKFREQNADRIDRNRPLEDKIVDAIHSPELSSHIISLYEDEKEKKWNEIEYQKYKRQQVTTQGMNGYYSYLNDIGYQKIQEEKENQKKLNDYNKTQNDLLIKEARRLAPLYQQLFINYTELNKVIEKEIKDRQNLQGATNDLVSDRAYPVPIGPEPYKPVGDHNKANASIERLKQRRYEQQVEAFGYAPGMGDYYARINDIPSNIGPTFIEGASQANIERQRAQKQQDIQKQQNEKGAQAEKIFEEKYQQRLKNYERLNRQREKRREERRQNEEEIKQLKIQYATNPKSVQEGDLLKIGAITPSELEQQHSQQKAESLKREQEGVKALYQKIGIRQEYTREGLRLRSLFDNADTVQQQYDAEQAVKQAVIDKERQRQRDNIERGRKVAQYQQEIGDFGGKTNQDGKNALDAGPVLATLFDAVDGDNKRVRLQFLKNVESVGGQLSPEQKVEKLGLQGGTFLGDLLIKQANKLPEDTKSLEYSNKFTDTADKIDTMVEPLHRLNDALFRAGEVFPPLTIAAYGLEGALSLVTMVTDGLRFAQEAYAFVAGLLGLAIDEEAASTGVLTAAKYGNIIANWLETGAEEQNAAAKLIGAGITWIQAGAEALLNAIRVIGMGPLLLIIAAVAALIAIVYVSEQNHANALKESQKALEKSNQSMKSAIANYKSMRSARLGEQDATRKHMAALKESIALKKLETDRSKRLMDIDKNTKLKNDDTWGEYGLRAQVQKSRGWLSLLGGVGVLLDASAGEYKNTSEDHEGTSEQIRAILDSESAFGLSNNQYQNYVDTYYKQHAYDFGRMDQFAPQLQDLYGLETQLQRSYGTEGARDSEEFRRAVQEMANETGLSGEVIGQYLDQMQVEANVEYARTNAQSEFGRIQADASAAAMKVLYPETGNMNDQEALQYNMIMSAVNDEAYKAKRELFMNAIMEYVQAIVAVLTGDWGNIGKHVNAGNEYIKGVGQINENQQRIAEESLEVGKANLRKDYGTKSYSFYGDTPFGGAVEAAHSMGMSVPSSGGAQSSNPISTQSNNSAGTSASTSASSQTALNTAHKSLNSASEALDATTTAPTSTDNQATGLGDIASGIVNKALDFAKHYDPIVAVIDSIFSDDNSNTSGTSQPNVNKYEININTININTEDDPTKIKTAFMNLMIEMSEQITPRQVSRTVGSTSNQNTNATTEGVDVNINNNNNNNANPTL